MMMSSPRLYDRHSIGIEKQQRADEAEDMYFEYKGSLLMTSRLRH